MRCVWCRCACSTCSRGAVRVGGATVVSVRAHGRAGRAACAAPSARRAPSARLARRRRVVGVAASTPAERRRRERRGCACSWVACSWAGRRGSRRAAAASTTTRAAASGAAPPLGPERGGHARERRLGGGFRDAYTLRCAFGQRVGAVLARYVDESQLECSSPVHALGRRACVLSMNAQQYARRAACGVHVPAGGGGELHLSGACARGGRHAADGARQRLLVGVGGARRADVPRRRRGASRACGRARARSCATRRARARARRGSRRATTRASTRRAACACVWCRCACSTCSRGAVRRRRRDGGERARARRAGRAACAAAFGEAAAAARGAGAAARRRRGGAARRRGCVGRAARRPSAVGWVGVQLSSFHGGLSSGGSFYYHGARWR